MTNKLLAELNKWQLDLTETLLFADNVSEETKAKAENYKRILREATSKVERVQELEKSEEEWISFQVSVNNTILNLEEQNKRYCEAIKQAIGLFNYDESAEGTKVLREALEQTI